MKLVELKNKCKDLGIRPTPTKHRLNPDRYEVSMDDCIKALQKYSLDLVKGTQYEDPNLKFILKLRSPMLATLISRLDKKIANDIWNDSNTDWIFEEKIDGIRCFVAYNHLTDEFHLYSRALDEETMLPVDYKDRINMSTLPHKPIPFDFVLDTELKFGMYPDMGHETIEEILEDPYKNINTYKPIFIVFDMIKLGNYSFLEQTLSYRRREAFKVVNYLRQNGIDILTTVNEKPSSYSKEEYYNYLVSQGAEGVIAKNINDAYNISGTRSNSWVKIKRNKYEGYAGMYNDTYDLFVSSATILNDTVNGLVLSSYVVDESNNYIYDKYGNRQSKVMGILYDLRPELRNMLTSYVDNRATLNDRYLNRVIEVSSSGFNPDTQKLNNLNFVCWRIDKTHESCKVQLAEIL